MRVTTDFWASALIRRIFSDGGFAAVAKRGATEAGAVFIVSRNRLGEIALYGPASQTAYGEGRPDDRRFSELMTSTDPGAIDARLEKEQRFDSDIWIVEVEAGPIAIGDLVALAEP